MSNATGEQQQLAKMPAAMPNGAPPQWGQEVDFKSNLTSQSKSKFLFNFLLWIVLCMLSLKLFFV